MSAGHLELQALEGRVRFLGELLTGIVAVVGLQLEQHFIRQASLQLGQKNEPLLFIHGRLRDKVKEVSLEGSQTGPDMGAEAL